jgi:hypothetical protein
MGVDLFCFLEERRNGVWSPATPTGPVEGNGAVAPFFQSCGDMDDEFMLELVELAHHQVHRFEPIPGRPTGLSPAVERAIPLPHDVYVTSLEGILAHDWGRYADVEFLERLREVRERGEIRVVLYIDG